MASPLISVCIPTYRGSTVLAAAIDSALTQTHQYFEIWILDDNSPDDSEAVVSRHSDPRITHIHNAHSLGLEGNWNKSLEFARGKYFKLLPHDDVLATNRLT